MRFWSRVGVRMSVAAVTAAVPVGLASFSSGLLPTSGTADQAADVASHPSHAPHGRSSAQHEEPRTTLTGTLQLRTAAERNRNEGYLYWLAWIAQNTTSIFSTRDAQGSIRRVTAGGVNCNTLAQISGGISGQLPAEFKTTINGTLGSLPGPVKTALLGALGQAGPDPTVDNLTDFSKVLNQLGLCAI